MDRRLVTGAVLLLAAVVGGVSRTQGQVPHASPPVLEVLPEHYLLHPGEQIHYQVRVREGGRSESVPHYEFDIETPGVVRLLASNGELSVEGVRSGRTALRLRTPTAERRLTLEVAG